MQIHKTINLKELNREGIDYKEIDLLRKFINDQGKILPRRFTGLNSKEQKQITKSIKRARILALMPFLKKN